MRRFITEWREWGFAVALWNWRFMRFADHATKQGYTRVRVSRSRG